jgi:hypothetical protein
MDFIIVIDAIGLDMTGLLFRRFRRAKAWRCHQQGGARGKKGAEG